MKTKQQGLRNNFDELYAGHEALGIESIYDFSQEILEYIYDNEVRFGRSKTTFFGGLIFASCRSKNKPINPQDISNYFGEPKYIILATAKQISNNVDFVDNSPINWTAYLDDLCTYFSVSEKTKDKAIEIGEIGENKGIISGRCTRSYAVATLYASTCINSTKDRITQKKLYDYTGVSESTIREIYKEQLGEYNNE